MADCLCHEEGLPCYCDDLPSEPLNLWDFEEDWRRTDIDTERLNRSELLAEELQEAAERVEEAQRLGTLG